MMPGIAGELKTLQLLLVEDDRDDEFLAKAALQRVGIENITVAHDGAMAVAMLLGEHRIEPGLVILDLRLPKIDGVQVLRRLREDAGTRDLPVIVMTSSNDPSDRGVCRSLGVSAILGKPLKAADLRSVLGLC